MSRVIANNFRHSGATKDSITLNSDGTSNLSKEIDTCNSNIAMLGFKTAVNGSLAKYSLVDQVIDEYVNATGVDASASTNETLASGSYSGITSTQDSYDLTYHYTGSDVTIACDNGDAIAGTVKIWGGGGGTKDGGGATNNYGGSAAFASATFDFTSDGTDLIVSVGQGGQAEHSNSYDGGGGGGYSGIFLGSKSQANTLILAAGGGGAGGNGPRTGGYGGAFGGNGGGGYNIGVGGTVGNPGTQSAGGSGPGGYANDGLALNGGTGGTNATITNSNGSYNGGAAGGEGSNSSGGGSGDRAGGGGGGGYWGGSGGKGGLYSGDDGSGGGGGSSYYNTGSYWSGTPSSEAGTENASGTTPTAGGDNDSDYPTSGTTAYPGRGALSGGENDGGNGLIILDITVGADVYGDLTLQSVDTTASAAPTEADLVTLIENSAGTATINTDIKGWVSRDSGANFTQGTLVDEGSWGTNKKIYAFHNLDISGQPSGTSMCYKITTHNQSAGKVTKIHATSLGWK